MSFSKEVWDKLSAINVNEHAAKKGNFTYLSWSWAWSALQSYYPESNYAFREPVFHSDGSCEIFCDLTVQDGEQAVTRTMWLAVMDFRNNADTQPNARSIGDTRMRCLVKAMAMFGLGFYIYAGEDLPSEEKELNQQQANEANHNAQQTALDEAVARHEVSLEAIRNGIATNDYETAYEAWHEIDQDSKMALWVAPSKFTNPGLSTAERKAMQSNEWVSARKSYLGE